MASIRASVMAIAFLTALAAGAAAQTTTSTTTVTSTTTLPLTTNYLKCYKAADPLGLEGPGPAWLQLDVPGLAQEHCRIMGGFRMVCLPAAAQLTAPIQSRIGSGPFAPLTPITLPTEETLTQD